MSHSSKLPPTVYATADLPANPRSGDTVFDSDLGILKYWDGSQWSEVGKLGSVVAGTNVTIDNTDPINPIISAAGGGGGGTTLSGTTTGTTPTEIFVDGVANNRMTIVGGTTWIFSAYIVATDEDSDGDKAGYKIEGVITNIGGVNSTTSLVGNSVKTVLSEDNPSWDATVVADDTNNALTFVVTGSSTVHWSATVTKTEVGATNLLPI